MNISLVRGDNVALTVGGAWLIEFFTTDEGVLAVSNPAVTITTPDSTEVLADFVDGYVGGFYAVRYTVLEPGRYIAKFDIEDVDAKFITAYANPLIDSESYTLTVSEYKAWSQTSTADNLVQAEIDAEASAQRARCRFPADFRPDLKQALKRRVLIALAQKGLPFEQTVDAVDGSRTFTPSNDPMVRRLEAPYRKVRLGC